MDGAHVAARKENAAMADYDVVVVGAGTAGSVVARRLADPVAEWRYSRRAGPTATT
jgi:ribulose 1,5-bisphosphate synthetase/thiazole synthase